MGLKVWLPLNEDFRNQGTGKLDAKISQADVTFEPGKIGNNPVFSANATNYVTCQELVGVPCFSVSFFIKATDNETFTQWADVFNATNFRLEFSNAAGTNINLFGFGYDGGGLGNITIDKIWHHITYTYENNTFIGYCDGVQKVKRMVQTPGTIWSGKFRLGDTQNSYFSLADFRIYDECLSQKQIHEISKGLVCHYKLVGTGTNKNYILNSSFSGKTDAGIYSFSDDIVTFEASEFNQTGNSFALSIDNSAFNLFKSKNLTLSMEYKIDTALTFGTTNPWVGFELVLTRNGTTGGSTQYLPLLGGKNIPTGVTSGWVKYTKTVRVTNYECSAAVVNFYMRDTTGKVSFRHPKIEIGTVATDWFSDNQDYLSLQSNYDKFLTTDISGYGYNATKSGTLPINLNSPRYNGSTKFDNGFLHIIPSPLNINSDAFTISCWFYPTKKATMALINDRKAVGEGLSVFYYGDGIRFDSGGAYQWQAGNITLNTWNHVAVTWNKNEAFKKLYINGTLINSTSSYGTLANIGNVFSIGASSSNGAAGGNQVYGSMSDFRIYATALSAEDILTLYKNAGAIDNKNNFYSFELGEPQMQSYQNQMPTNVNRYGATLTMTLEDEPLSITGKATKIVCTAAGQGWYWGNWGKTDLINGEQYIFTAYIKSSNRTTFRMNIEAGHTGHIIFPVSSEYTKIEYPFTYDSSTQYSAWTCYQSPNMTVDDDYWIHSIAIYKADEYNKSKINKNRIVNMNEFNEYILPNDYLQLDYIENTGTQYIDTEYKLKSNCSAEYSFMVTGGNVSNSWGIAGIYNNSNDFYFGMIRSEGRNLNYRFKDTFYPTETIIQSNIKYDVKASLCSGNQYLILNGIKEIESHVIWNAESSLNCYIFAVNGISGMSFVGRLYKFKLYNNGKIVRNYIPALRQSDKQPGLYDLVNNVFYTNAGTEEFKYSLNGIPSDYVQLDYLESSSTQYIDTGIQMSDITKIITDFQFTIIDSGLQSFFGRYSTTNGFQTVYNGTTGNFSFRWKSNSGSITGDCNRHVIELSNTYCKLDNSTWATYTDTKISDTATLLLFARRKDNSGEGIQSYSNVKIYACKIYNEETLVRNFIPVQRINDGVLGLYDIVSQTFFTNAGTGTFQSKLRDIPSEYTQLDYIESSGTQYIDTGVPSKPTLKTIIDFQLPTIPSNQSRLFARKCDNGSATALSFDFYINGSGYFAWACQNGSGNWQATNKYKDTLRHTFILDSFENKVNLDKNVYTANITTTRTTIDTQNIYIFCGNTNSSGAGNFISMKLYNFQIWDLNQLIRNFIPVKRNSDNVLGLYDTVNQNFYLNQGTNDFTSNSLYIKPKNSKIYKTKNILQANSLYEI